MSLRFQIFRATIACSLASACLGQSTLWVDDDNCPGGSGSQPDPFCTIQAAVSAASSGDTILVRPGTYMESVNVPGALVVTIRSDADGNAVTNDPVPESTIMDATGTNCSVIDFPSGANGILEGFTITGGEGCYDGRKGGGISLRLSSTTIRGCIIRQNGGSDGAGIYIKDAPGTVLIENNVIEDNVTVNTGGTTFLNGGGGLYIIRSIVHIIDNVIRDNEAQYGGGIHLQGHSDALIDGNLISGNHVRKGGGAIFGTQSAPLIRCNIFRDNDGVDEGGALNFSGGSNPQVVQNVFTRNRATGAGSGNGGAIVIRQSSSPVLVNNVFCANSAALFGGAIRIDEPGISMTVRNCIFWDNTANSGGNAASANNATLTMSHCTVGGGFNSIHLGSGGALNWGSGMLESNPLFLDASGPDGISGTLDDDLRLSPLSPCIDAGNNASVPGYLTGDLDHHFRFCDSDGTPDTGSGSSPVVDMGPYEAQSLPETAFCFGTACPCGNDTFGVGCMSTGCRNSTGRGARLTTFGWPSVGRDSLLLRAENCPPLNLGLFVWADSQLAPVVVGDGQVCVGGGAFRFAPSFVAPDGTMTLESIVGTLPAGLIRAGDMSYFQAWTRDVFCTGVPVPCPSPCLGGSNLTNAIGVTFVP